MNINEPITTLRSPTCHIKRSANIFSACLVLFMVHSMVPVLADSGDIIEIIDIDADVLELEDLNALAIDSDYAPSSGMTKPNIPEAVMPDIFKQQANPSAEATPEPTDSKNDNVKVNVIEVSERYYLLEYDASTQSYFRALTQEANPGDLIEIEVTATNQSDETVKEVEMVNTLPTGPVAFIKESVRLDNDRGFYRISATGQTFFAPETDINAADIRFIKWQIFSLGVKDTLRLSYQIKILD